MTLWTDIAQWRGPTPNTSGSVTDHMYVVVHTADGSYEGTIAWQKNPDANVSSHFVVAKDGRIAQMLDTNAKSWTQINGNPYSISIENEGNENTPLTDAQLTANARILARAHQVHGIPLQLTSRVGTRGLGHHSMGAESGVNWGHSLCPGNIIKAQKPQILARAVALAGGAPIGGDDMALSVDDLGKIWTTLGNGVTPAGYVDGTVTDPNIAKQIEMFGGVTLRSLADQIAELKTDVVTLKAGGVDRAVLVEAFKAALQDPAVRQVLVDAANEAEDS